jgi:malate dehydrogenase
VIGASGVERIVELQLTADEQAMFDNSISAVQGLMDVLKNPPVAA